MKLDTLLKCEDETEAGGCDMKKFRSIMFRWRCSLWKCIWKQLLKYTAAFLLISYIYREWLSQEYKIELEEIIGWCRATSKAVPLTFILGFFVNNVIRRWWEFYSALPYPDRLAMYLHIAVDCGEEKGRLMCRTIVRYCLLAYILCLRRISPRLSRSIPEPAKLIEMGIASEKELEEIKKIDTTDLVERSNKMNDVCKNWWIPIQWSLEIIVEGLNASDKGGPAVNKIVFRDLVKEILDYKKKLQIIDSYGAFSIVPLAYAQVTSLAVYVYFAISLIGDQWMIGEDVDLYYPVFLTFKFLFFYGWLKVAHSLYNPFGEDDEDIDLNRCIARHLTVALAIVDQKDYKKMDEDLEEYAKKLIPTTSDSDLINRLDEQLDHLKDD